MAGVWGVIKHAFQEALASADRNQHGCEDQVLDGPASGGKGFKDGPYKYCNPRT